MVTTKGESADGKKPKDELCSFLVADAGKSLRVFRALIDDDCPARLGMDIYAFTSGPGRFPWVGLLEICAKTNIKMINWPDLITPPKRPSKGKSKGIGGLHKVHKDALLKQIKDPKRLLSFSNKVCFILFI